jgi:hypothetical protein
LTAGHSIPEELPEETAAALLEFFGLAKGAGDGFLPTQE